ncbi:Hint domain-containing protein [Roseisalinus antarcticus]|uniref:Hedgehog/Intein (Hint) domain-containing protein n=1 Tax=Roseisalinus antarcticus TaxID=254357 RepID=A0A1Y5TYH6_9RHOB|nr:Hint domain-containing protein [Roseisalinus antarcticus]SLN76985.1 hypothetical protein ROA7023_04286 [Roseisalinus antarcticus]
MVDNINTRCEAGVQAHRTLSPQHRILVSRAMAEMMLCAPDVLVPARAFLGQAGVRRMVGGLVRYPHILFARHQVVPSQGLPSESDLPGVESLSTITPRARADIMAPFPGLAPRSGGLWPRPTPTLRTYKAQALLAA